MHEIFEHTADLGLRVRASTLPELFVDAAHGLFSMIVTPEDQADRPVECPIEKSIRIGGTQLEYLMFDWLNELLALFETDRFIGRRFDVAISPDGLQATAHGTVLDHQRDQLEHEVKAITYHGLKVQQKNGEWLTEVIVDI